jgi:predicted TIM-barrel fold metal-dependent hydrolase
MKTLAAEQSELVQAYLALGYCTDCGVIDLHGHYGPWPGIYLPRANEAAMLASMDRCGIATLVSSGHNALADMAIGNPEMAAVARRHPGRWYAYLVCNPRYPDELLAQLATFDAEPAYVGLKLHPTMHEYPLDGQAYRPVYEFAAERGAMILTHTWGHNALCGPQQLAAVAECYPQVTFLAGHSFHGEFDAGITVARLCPNVMLELTAAYSVRGVVEHLVAQVGAERVLYGCDLPWFDPHYALGCVLLAHISDADRRAILRENGLRLLSEQLAKKGSRYDG